MTGRTDLRAALVLACAMFGIAGVGAVAKTQETTSAAAQSQNEKQTATPDRKPRQEAVSEPEEENEKLTHSASVQYIARKTGMSVHQVHLVTFTVNFLLVAFLI